MATIDIEAPDVQFRQKGRAARQMLSQKNRARKAADNSMQLMTLAERQQERAERAARAPQVREERRQGLQSRPPSLRQQVADLTTRIERLSRTK